MRLLPACVAIVHHGVGTPQFPAAARALAPPTGTAILLGGRPPPLTVPTGACTYHGVTQSESPTPRPPAADPDAPEAAATAEPDADPTPAEAVSEKKERVLHTRVPAVLERELKRFAENLRIPVSNLVRAILEDAVEAADLAGETVEGRLTRAAQQLGLGREKLKQRVLPDPLAGVYAFQAVTLAQPAACAKCRKDLRPGDRAHIGLTDAPPKSPQERLFVCAACLPHG